MTLMPRLMLRLVPRTAPVVALVVAALLTGCAAGPRRTTVTLLPDDDGQVGAVTVSSANTTQRLDQAYSALVADHGATGPARFAVRGRTAVDAEHGDLLRAQPPKPANFVLYFLLDSTTLTPDSDALLKSVIEAAQARKPTEITVFGHADESGTAQRNLKLSADRAQAVADILRKIGPDLGSIEVHSFGDKAPLVSTGSRKAEPRNRRVEVGIL